MITFYDHIEENTTTTGTGDITLSGATTGNTTFTYRYSDSANDAFTYAINGVTEWETGIGHLSSSSTLVRDQVFLSSNSDNLVSFSAGTKTVSVTNTSAYYNKDMGLDYAGANGIFLT